MEYRIFYIEYIPIALMKLLPYLRVTLGITAVTVLFALALSALIVRGRLSKNRVANKMAQGYVGALRCTPSIVLLFIVFFGLPQVLLGFGININFWPKAVFVVVALTLLYAANLSEIFRGALDTLGKGQYEAAISMGLTDFQAYTRIVLPQVFKIALPNLGNSYIALLKEGSLAYTIGLVDLMGQGSLIIARNYGGYTIETYIALAIIYWALTILSEQAFRLLERIVSVRSVKKGGFR